MELIKRNIHMDRIRVQASTQFTMEEDVNLPESKPDVNQIHLEKGEICIDEVKSSTDCVMVRGRLQYAILYHTGEDGYGLVSLTGKIPFEEKIHMEGVTVADMVMVEEMLEDLTVTLINSRKLSLQAFVCLKAWVNELYDQEIPIACKGEEPLEYRRRVVHPMQILVDKRDVLRVKHEITLPSNYPNVCQILWKDIALRDIEWKLMEDKIVLSGEVCVSLIYEGEGEEHGCRCYETVFAFQETMDAYGCGEGMIGDVTYRLHQQDVVPRPDFDGELRCVGVELVIDVCARVYQEETVEMLEDVYGITKDVDVHMQERKLNRILGCITAKTKVTERMKVDMGPVFQLLHWEGRVIVERKNPADTGIFIQGVIPVKAMYVTEGDESPYGSVCAQIPFQYTIEVPGISEEDMGEVKAELEQLQVTMLDGEEMDVKAVLRFSTLVFHSDSVNVIEDVKYHDLDREKIKKLPGMVVYVVKPGDSLWSIGKMYHVSVDSLKQWNQLEGDELQVGQKLLIIKDIIPCAALS